MKQLTCPWQLLWEPKGPFPPSLMPTFDKINTETGKITRADTYAEFSQCV